MRRHIELGLRSPVLPSSLLVVACSCLTVSSLLTTRGLPNTADGALHLFRSLELVEAWRTGDMYPRWAPHFCFGFGYPIFNYVPPLLRYLAGATSLAGLTMQDAMKVVVALGVVAGSFGVFLFVSRFCSMPAAAIAGCAYALAPVRLFEVYIQGNYPQLLATAVMPYCLLAACSLGEGAGKRAFILLGTSTSFLFLCHNISALLFFPIFVAYAGWHAARCKDRRMPLVLALALLSGALMASFFVLPAWLERPFVQTERLRVGFFDFRHYFVDLPELLAFPQRLDFRCANPYFPRSVGGHVVLAALPSLAMLGRNVRARGEVAFMWASVGLCLFMASPVSEPVWSAVPVLAYVEFPARVLNVAGLALAVLVGAAVDAWAGYLHGAWLPFALTIVIIGACPYLFPRKPFIDWSGATVTDVVQFESESGALGTTSAGEYLPRAVTERPSADWWEWFQNVEVRERTSRTVRLTVEAEKAGSLALPVFYFPDWQAEVDGMPAEVRVQHLRGMAQVRVPQGVHDVILRLADTPVRVMAWKLSLIGVGLLIVGAIVVPSGQRGCECAGLASDGWSLIIAAAGSVMFLVVKATYLEPRTMAFRSYSPPGTVVGAQHALRESFGGRVALLGYSIQRNLPVQGEPLSVTLYWQPLMDLDRDYVAMVRMESLVDGRVFLTSRHENPGGIPSSHWHPALFVEDRHTLRLPADLPAVRYAVRVALYDAQTGEALETTSGDAVTLQEVQVVYHLPLDIHRFPKDRWYRFGSQIRLIGFSLDRDRIKGGDTLRLDLFWRADEPVDVSLKRFVHLVDAGGSIVTQRDEWPVQGLYPTDCWLPQHNIRDPVSMKLPVNLPPGQYELVVGLYDQASLERAVVHDRSGAEIQERAVRLPVSIIIE